MAPDDKDAPRGALEEAVALADDAFTIAHNAIADVGPEHKHYDRYCDKLEDIRRRRAALEPRLAKRRENQAKNRDHCRECGAIGHHGPTCSKFVPPKVETSGEPDYPRCKICGEKHFDGMGDDFHT